MNTLEKAIEKALQPLQREKTGANFQKLPIRYQNSIDSNLKLSDTMYQYLSENPNNPNNMTDEWNTAIGKDKRKVITQYVDGKMLYTVKKGNKILLKTNSKEQTANKITEFYNEYL